MTISNEKENPIGNNIADHHQTHSLSPSFIHVMVVPCTCTGDQSTGLDGCSPHNR